jgi:GNAT superfamily N-acetyltransferase
MFISSALAERSEAETMYDFVRRAPDAVRARYGIDAIRLGGGVVLSVRDDPSHFWSKTLGFGFDEPLTAELIEEVCAFYRVQRNPVATLRFAPEVLPEDWDEICAKRDISRGGAQVKLACEVDTALARIEDFGRSEPTLRVEPMRQKDARRSSELMFGVFKLPEPAVEMAVASVGRPGWQAFAAWDGDRMVGTAASFIHQETAQYFAASTLPEARGRGGQSALIAARARAAKSAGCHWMVAQTNAEAPGEHNTSLHNMLRAGFEVVYERRDWVLKTGV